MNTSELHGKHEPNKGEAITIQQLLDLLQSIPPEARNSRIVDDNHHEITGVWIFLKADKLTSGSLGIRILA